MKNMKIKKRLITAFLIVVALGTLIGIIGIIGIYSINNSLNSIYEGNLTPLPVIADSRENLQVVCIELRDMLIHSEDAASYEPTVKEAMDNFAVAIEEYATHISRDETQKLFDDSKKIWMDEVAVDIANYINIVKTQDEAASVAALDALAVNIDKIVANLLEISSYEVGDAEKAYQDSDVLFYTLFAIIAVVVVAAVSISIALALSIANMISKPLERAKDLMAQVGKYGDLTISQEEDSALQNDMKGTDEIAELIVAFHSLFVHIERTSNALSLIAEGDLTGEINTLSDKDALGVSLRNMQDSLNRMFGDINEATEQVSSGANQVSDGAQALALGSTEQASAIEELSSSIEIIANKTQENATMATQAAELSSSIKTNAETGTEQMAKMMQAVKEINEASISISNVIKVIDDIAFQTNILALNAAVEAARAGQHGKGFAVVADEVRNLASKSAEAAKNTSSLIANSMEKAELGAKIADSTANSLNQIVTGINQSTELVGKIAESSEEQTVGINQINVGIEQVAQVVQQNSATAEESAAASEEMSGQATLLAGLVAQFRLK